MRRYRSAAQVKRCLGEKTLGISKTVPDLAPTMREMLQRHAMGITDNVQQNVFYSGDLPDMRGLEPHQITSLLDSTRETVKALEEARNAEIVERRQKQYEEKRQRDIELLKELQKTEQ